jgi:hypothetical protein
MASTTRDILRVYGRPAAATRTALVGLAAAPYNSRMEKEFIDRARAIREGILQLRDSL